MLYLCDNAMGLFHLVLLARHNCIQPLHGAHKVLRLGILKKELGIWKDFFFHSDQ